MLLGAIISAHLLTLSLVVSLPLASSLSEDVKAVPVLPFAVSKRISLLCFSLIMINFINNDQFGYKSLQKRSIIYSLNLSKELEHLQVPVLWSCKCSGYFKVQCLLRTVVGLCFLLQFSADWLRMPFCSTFPQQLISASLPEPAGASCYHFAALSVLGRVCSKK